VKVIIVGAGLSGLATAIALRKYVTLPKDDTLDITIYDKADPHEIGDHGFDDHSDIRLKNQGAAISLQPIALRVLRDLSPDLADRVHASGYPCTHFTWKTACNILLGKDYLDLLPVSRPILVQCLA
jgi:2-polyprenyl-6-methoxyphenol hydroxylase-like FAD-dependent oxidoreductase